MLTHNAIYHHMAATWPIRSCAHRQAVGPLISEHAWRGRPETASPRFTPYGLLQTHRCPALNAGNPGTTLGVQRCVCHPATPLACPRHALRASGYSRSPPASPGPCDPPPHAPGATHAAHACSPYQARPLLRPCAHSITRTRKRKNMNQLFDTNHLIRRPTQTTANASVSATSTCIASSRCAA